MHVFSTEVAPMWGAGAMPAGARQVSNDSALWANAAVCTRPTGLTTFQQRHQQRRAACAAAKAVTAAEAEVQRQQLAALPAAGDHVEIDITGDDPVELAMAARPNPGKAGCAARQNCPPQGEQQERHQAGGVDSLQALQIEALREELVVAEAVVADLKKHLRDAERAMGLRTLH